MRRITGCGGSAIFVPASVRLHRNPSLSSGVWALSLGIVLFCFSHCLSVAWLLSRCSSPVFYTYFNACVCSLFGTPRGAVWRAAWLYPYRTAPVSCMALVNSFTLSVARVVVSVYFMCVCICVAAFFRVCEMVAVRLCVCFGVFCCDSWDVAAGVPTAVGMQGRGVRLPPLVGWVLLAPPWPSSAT